MDAFGFVHGAEDISTSGRKFAWGSSRAGGRAENVRVSTSSLRLRREPFVGMSTRMSNCSRSAVALMFSVALVGCGDNGGGGKGSATLPVRSARLDPRSLEVPSATAKASVAAPPPAVSSAPAALSKDGCPETEPDKRACSAAQFEKAWQAAKDPSTHPSRASYRITGKVTKVETSDPSKGETGDTRVYMKGDKEDVGFIFKAKSKDIDAVSKLKPDAEATFVCRFGGLEEIGIVTLDDCTL